MLLRGQSKPAKPQLKVELLTHMMMPYLRAPKIPAQTKAFYPQIQFPISRAMNAGIIKCDYKPWFPALFFGCKLNRFDIVKLRFFSLGLVLSVSVMDDAARIKDKKMNLNILGFFFGRKK